MKHENRGPLVFLATPSTPLKEFAQNPKAPRPPPSGFPATLFL